MLDLLRNWYKRHFSAPGTVEFAIVLIAVFICIYYFMWLFGPLVIALCIAYFLDWWVSILMKKCKLNRFFSSLIVMLVFLGLSLLVVILVFPLLINQALDLYHTLMLISHDAVINGKNSNLNALSGENIDNLIFNELNLLIAQLPEPFPNMIDKASILNAIKVIRTQGISSIVEILKVNFAPSVFNAVSYLMYMIIVPILVFLMLKNKEYLKRGVLTYILPNNQVLIKQFWPSINSQISGYVRGKIIHIIIIALVNSLALMLLHVNYAVLLGISVGLSVIIPYVGAVLVAIPFIFVVLMQFGISYDLAIVLFVYVLIQIIDANVLTPILFSKAVNLDAFSILVAIMIFGSLWGFWGVFLAIPLATFIKTLIINWPSSDKSPPAQIEHK